MAFQQHLYFTLSQREENECECVVLFTMIHNERQRGESADCGVVPSISFAFSTSGLSLRVRIMINYPRAAFFCVQTQLSPAFGCYLPACTLLLLPNKSCFWSVVQNEPFWLKGPYRTITIFYVCYFEGEKKICTGSDAIKKAKNAF